MSADETVIPGEKPLEGPVEGEAGLTSMLCWNDDSEKQPGPSAGLVALNWTAGDWPHAYEMISPEGQRSLVSLRVDQLATMLDALAREGVSLEMIYFTGADPAGHPQLGEFIELARAQGITDVGLQCSALRIARDDGLLRTLAQLRPRLFIEFDGFDETASLILHGRRDLPFVAGRGIDRLAAAGLPAALLANVARGINLQEVGAIAAFGMHHPAVHSAIFRPVPLRQSRLGAPPAGYVTASGIIDALERQSDGLFSAGVFSPVRCCRPLQHFVAQIPYGRSPATLSGLSGNGYAGAAGPGSCFWLGVHEFMTPWRKDLDQAPHCPLVILTPDGRRIPYCLYSAKEVT